MNRNIFKEKNILSLAGNFSFAAIGMLNFVLLTRGYSKADFGDWVLFIASVNFLNLFRFGLTKSGLVRFCAGANMAQKKEYLGTSFLLGLVMVALSAMVFLPLSYFFADSISMRGYQWTVVWYPLLSLLNLPWNNALSYLQAEQRFDIILWVRLSNVLSFTVVLLASLFYFHWSIEIILYCYLATQVFSSLITGWGRWDGLVDCLVASRKKMAELFNYGIYTLGSLAGSNLLKSADTFILGLSPVLGPTGIALYAIPLKLTEILEIPLRSFIATAFPKMSKASTEGNLDKMRSIYYTYSGAITLLFVPVVLVNLLLADQFVWLLGGSAYKESASLLGNTFRVFAIYGLFLPLDRLTGVALDSINRPKLNFYKVLIMAAANIIGDFIAVFVFESLVAVALVTLLFTLIGLYFGFYFLNRELPIRLKPVFVHGFEFIKTIKNKF